VAVQRPKELDIFVEATEGFNLVAIIADAVTAANSQILEAKLKGLSTCGSRFLLDLSAVRFIDSNGIGVVVSFMRAIKAKGGTLKLCGLTSSVRGVFKLIHLDHVFDIFETREEAVRSSIQ
jgi:anti-sigma B factor antagonist